MKICAFVFGFLFIAGLSFAADIDGAWSGETQSFGGFGGGAVTALTFIFKADGETLTGYTIPKGMNIQVPLRDGVIKGNKIWFLVDVNLGGTNMVISYKGKVKGDKINLKFKSVTENTDSGGFEQQVILKRVSN